MLAKIRSNFFNSDFAKNVAKLTAGTAIAQGVLIIASPLLSRLYTPEQFGTFTFFSSLVSIISIIASGRYELSIIIAKTRRLAINLLGLCALLILAISLVCLIFALIFKTEIGAMLATENSYIVALLIPLAALFISLFNLMTYWSNRFKYYTTIATSKVIQNSTNIVVATICGFFYKFKFGLLYGYTLGAFVAVFFIGFKSLKQVFRNKNQITLDKITYVAKKFKDFPLYSMPNSFLDTFSNQAPVFFITMYFGASYAGQYGMAFRIISIPITLIGGSIAQVFFQQFSESFKKNGANTNLLFKTWKNLFILGLFPCAILLIFGPSLFEFVFGDSWVKAGEIARYLAIMYLLILVSSPTSTAMIVLGAQKASFLFGLSSAIYRPLAFYIGYIFNNFELGLILFASLEIIQIVLYNLLILRLTTRAQIY